MSDASRTLHRPASVTRELALAVASTQWRATVRKPGTSVCNTKECAGWKAITVQKEESFQLLCHW
jgi:hypothetical protein